MQTVLRLLREDFRMTHWFNQILSKFHFNVSTRKQQQEILNLLIDEQYKGTLAFLIGSILAVGIFGIFDYFLESDQLFFLLGLRFLYCSIVSAILIFSLKSDKAKRHIIQIGCFVYYFVNIFCWIMILAVSNPLKYALPYFVGIFVGSAVVLRYPIKFLILPYPIIIFLIAILYFQPAITAVQLSLFDLTWNLILVWIVSTPTAITLFKISYSRVLAEFRLKKTQEALLAQELSEKQRLLDLIEEKTVELNEYFAIKSELRLKENKINLLKGLAGSIAHELRSPLGALTLKIRRLQKAPIDESDASKKIVESSEVDNLLRIIDRGYQIIGIILNNMKNQQIDASDFVILKASEVLASSLNDYGYHDEEREIVTLTIDEDFSFKGSDVLFNFVLFNLLKNSFYYLKRNDKGNRKIHIWTAVGEQVNAIHFKDNGPGIDDSVKEHLFENFVTSNHQEGTGLGLSFCKRAMHGFGGDIQCYSEIGQFTEFVLTFPVLLPESA